MIILKEYMWEHEMIAEIPCRWDRFRFKYEYESGYEKFRNVS